MEKIAIAKQLFIITNMTPVIYFQVSPELLDFTIHASGTIKIMSSTGQMEIPFDRHNLKEIVSMLDVSVFTSEKIIVTWNFKNFISYIRFYTKKTKDYSCKLFDLKLIEGFIGQRGNAPVNFVEARDRVMKLADNKDWKRIYEIINLPLMTRVVPTLECEGIVDIPKRFIAYAHYEIDRTPSGRMVCQLFKRGYSPHAIGSNENYKARGEEIFLYFDYRSMEIRILQWLSNDHELEEILNSKNEMYLAAWKKLTGQDTAPDQWKSSFLALFYGLGAEELSRKHGWSIEIGREVIRRSHKVFSKAFGYVLDVQEKAKHSPSCDYFGRPRDLQKEPYKARNHVIQSAANIVCMEKLIDLHDSLPYPARLAYSVHDGYALFCEIIAIKDVVKKVIPILESESKMCPGLKLSVSVKAGSRLNKMLAVPENWRK